MYTYLKSGCNPQNPSFACFLFVQTQAEHTTRKERDNSFYVWLIACTAMLILPVYILDRLP